MSCLNLRNDSRKRYVVKMRQKTKQHVKAWRITDFIEKVNNSYYKKELLKEIEDNLKNGINPENIVILDKSFDIHKANKDIKVLNLNTNIGVKKLYHLGKPYSLYPNKKIVICNNVFNTFSLLYTLFNQYKIKIHKSILKETITEIFSGEEKLVLDFKQLREELNQSLDLIEDATDKKYLNDKKETILKELKESIETEIKNAEAFIKIDSDIKNEDALKKKMKSVNYRELLSASPKRFTRYLISNVRPIVGIYNPDKNQIEILASNFIKKDGFDERQIDLKNVSHNSPFTVTIIAGVTLLMSVYQMHCNKYDANSINTNEVDTESAMLELNLDVEDDESQTEEVIEKSKVLIEEWQQTKDELNKLLQENLEVPELSVAATQNDVDIPFSVINSLTNAEKKVQNHFDKAFENNDFKDGVIEVEEEEEKDLERIDEVI